MAALKKCLLVPADTPHETQPLFATTTCPFPAFRVAPAFPSIPASAGTRPSLSDSNDSDASDNDAFNAVLAPTSSAAAAAASEASIRAATDAAINAENNSALAEATTSLAKAYANQADPRSVTVEPRKRGRPKRFRPDNIPNPQDDAGPRPVALHHRKRGRPREYQPEDIPNPHDDINPIIPGMTRHRVQINLAKRNLFRFYCKLRRLELGAALGDNLVSAQSRVITKTQLVNEFLNQTPASRYHYTHMYELWCLYQRQQIPLLPPVTSTREERDRRRNMLTAVLSLEPAPQKQLVDDWLTERTARQRERHADALETCLARRVLVKLKSDLLILANNIDYVLRDNIEPQRWQNIFSGI
jgi:hypothetical protein